MTDGLVSFLDDEPGNEGPRQTLICGATRGRWPAAVGDPGRHAPANREKCFPTAWCGSRPATSSHCRAAVGQSEVHAVLTAKVGGNGMTAQAGRELPAPSGERGLRRRSHGDR